MVALSDPSAWPHAHTRPSYERLLLAAIVADPAVLGCRCVRSLRDRDFADAFHSHVFWASRRLREADVTWHRLFTVSYGRAAFDLLQPGHGERLADFVMSLRFSVDPDPEDIGLYVWHIMHAAYCRFAANASRQLSRLARVEHGAQTDADKAIERLTNLRARMDRAFGSGE